MIKQLGLFLYLKTLKLIQPHFLIRKLYPNSLWRIKTNEKKVFLTFDDGPTPDVTSQVLQQLKDFGAKATFFCIGKNVALHTEIYQSIVDAKHSVGNHGQHHLNGWNMDNETYFNDVEMAAQLIKSQLYRPPYGKIKFKQAKELSKHYKLVFWDVLTYDFDERTTSDKMVKWVKKYTRNGSIITFHDSLKAWPRLEKALPEILYFLKQEGYAMEALK